MLSLSNRVLLKGFKAAAIIRQFHVPMQSHPSSLVSKYYIRKFSTSLPVITEPLENLGETIATAVLVSWHKLPGEKVDEDDVVAIIETDKVTMDIRARVAGTFVEGLAEVQSEVVVGSPLYKIQPL